MPNIETLNSWVVFVPGEHDGMAWGWDMVKVGLAADKPEAIEKAVETWLGGQTREGTYMVCRADCITAYEVEEARTPRVRNEVSLPSGN
jgi:hypothetical protein